MVVDGLLECFPSGVAVVATRSDGADHAIAVSAMSAVSARPPLVMVCIDRSTRFHDLIQQSGAWGISLLGQGDKLASSLLGSKTYRLAVPPTDWFDHVELAGRPVPIMRSTSLWMSCSTKSSYAEGDHSIIVGRVLGAGGDSPGAAPLLRHLGRYYRRGDAV